MEFGSQHVKAMVITAARGVRISDGGGDVMTCLVTGGAGYIGSHTVADLLDSGEAVVVVDNLSTGHRQAVPDVPFYLADIGDTAAMVEIMARHRVDAVIHFAAHSLVGESVRDPLKYYDNNVGASARLLSAMTRAGVRHIVFSSTAAIFGDPEHGPIADDHPKEPTNPYGGTKWDIEKMLGWAHRAYGLRSLSLRYFNAAGAHTARPLGEDHHPETHLIPIVLRVALGQRDSVSIFGTDYPTPDGTCIRDYVHVQDLAAAHRLAVQRLRQGEVTQAAFNLGNGTGFSVQHVVDVARQVTGHPIPVVMGARRPGDPAQLVASSERAKRELGWDPQYVDLRDIITSAWHWHSSHPQGYAR